jgi:hypothetical protein
LQNTDDNINIHLLDEVVDEEVDEGYSSGTDNMLSASNDIKMNDDNITKLQKFPWYDQLW